MVTYKTVSHSDLVILRDAAEADQNRELADISERALDQRNSYHAGIDADVDALEEVCDHINLRIAREEADAKDRAFQRSKLTANAVRDANRSTDAAAKLDPDPGIRTDSLIAIVNRCAHRAKSTSAQLRLSLLEQALELRALVHAERAWDEATSTREESFAGRRRWNTTLRSAL